MLRSFRIGKLFGIPLFVHTTFFLLPIWLLLSNGGFGLANALCLLLYLLGVFTCVVLHELGHALMARYFGIGTDSITLYPIGGVARLQRMSEQPFEEICIAFAGPAVNLVLAALLSPPAFLYLLNGAPAAGVLVSAEMSLSQIAGHFAFLLCVANAGLLLFNLLPCFPMDGGRVLRALLALVLGHLRATEIAVRIGLVLACLIAALALVLQSPMPILLAVFVYFAGQMELMALRQREARRRVTPMAESVPVAESSVAAPSAFSGVAWDSRHGVWVQWHNGQPVAYWG